MAAADALLRTQLVRGWRPDGVVRLGAPWASRVVNEWLGELDCLQVLVDRWGLYAAPDRLPGQVVVASPEAVCREVARAVPASANRDWARRWARAEGAAQSAIDATLAAEGGMTEPGIARALVRAAPAGSTLMVSSSMPVRDVEWWGKPRDGLRVLANRGANGIDGVLSTALGLAAATVGGDRGGGGRRAGSGEGSGARSGAADRRALALLGDLAFLYDAGALLGSASRGFHLDVVIVDNDGGGIFNFLPQASGQPPARFERLWGTPHGVDLCAVARSYGADAERATDLQDLTAALADPPKGHGVRALVAVTDRAANVTVHKRLHKAVEAAVMALAE